MANQRRSGKNAKILAQLSTVRISNPPEDLVPNTSPEIVDGVTYPPYSVWSGSKELWVDNPSPVLEGNFADGNTNRVFQIRYELGKVIVTPAGASGDSLTADYYYATTMDVGNMFNWKLDIKLENVDVTAFCDGYRQRVATYRDWSGTADGYQTNDYWFKACAQNNFFYVLLYPDKSIDEYWVGRAIVDWGATVPHTGAVTEAIKFTGAGSLSYKQS
ncbi:MAG: hypothetical protein NC820_07060 [Candidatus Omnitrophica bacterium]|nr:hypothetical protein [Candidatus Omnitrophota bacterium]